ncbi:MAG: sodium-dependent transporter, partial [Bacteroidetes bacterium]|nr:sodium-dependent transporter [Bacteroidota bacterium]
FLLVWSIPILLAEFSIGKTYKKGVIGSFASATGKKFAWMGFFIAMCTLFITFYYSVVTAWGLRYLGLSFSDLFARLGGGQTLAEKIQSNPEYLNAFWDQISNGNGLTIGLHVLSVVLGCAFLIRGIQKGLELANKILIPTLFVLLILIGIIALSMGNGMLGLEYMFAIRPELFGDAEVWIQALSQSAWSTGAGWGLIMTISSYSRDKEDVTLNIFIGGFGNNTASLVAGLAILPSVFALATSEAEAISYLGSGNQALTFSIIPKLFAEIPGGAFLSVIFFLAFFLAAFSSLLAMIELFMKILGDLGFSRQSSAIRAGLFCIIFGLPSAWSLDIFNNQDWVWGIGLIISGLFIIFAGLQHGAKKFKAEFIDKDSDFKVNDLYFSAAIIINAILGLGLIYWWMSQGYSQNPWFDENGNWNVFDVYSNASIITQWVIVLAVGIGLNRYLYKVFVSNQKAE